MNKRRDIVHLFDRFGMFSIIGPYIGQYDRWKSLLCSLCQSTKDSFERNKLGYQGLQRFKCRDIKMLNLIQKLNEYYEDDAFENKTISLNLISQNSHCEEFVKHSHNYLISELDKLSVYAMSEFSKNGLMYFNKFCCNSLPSTLKTLILHGDINADAIMPALKAVVPAVTLNITFKFLEFSDKALKVVLEGCNKATSLNFIDCLFNIDNETFTLNSSDDYNMKSLKIKNCKYAGTENNAREKGSKAIFKAISKTKMAQTLENIELDKRDDYIAVQDELFDDNFTLNLIMNIKHKWNID